MRGPFHDSQVELRFAGDCELVKFPQRPEAHALPSQE